MKSQWRKIQQAASVAPADGLPGKLTAQGVLSTWLPDVEPAATTKDVWRQIQKEAGATPDGDPGAKTAEAIIKRWIDVPQQDGGAQAGCPAGDADGLGEFKDLYVNDLIDARVHRLCVETVSVFESGSKTGGYSTVSIYGDGPGGARQITYGRCQTTESGNLKELLSRYVNAQTGTSAAKVIAARLPKVGGKPYLVNDQVLIQALKDAGKEKTMQEVQDAFFDDVYFNPAYRWFTAKGFTLPLSMLVIFDSFIHSGSILSFLINRFKEVAPAQGGDEKKWIAAYVDARQTWLANHSNSVLRQTVYRTRCFKDAIAKDNWDLAQPIIANGVAVS